MPSRANCYDPPREQQRVTCREGGPSLGSGARRGRPDGEDGIGGPAMNAAPERVLVHFEGDGAGTGALSWGQLENWSAIVKQKTWLPLGGVKAPPARTTVDDIAGDMRA